MLTLVSRITICLLTIILLNSAAYAESLRHSSVGNWVIEAYFSDDTGEFSFCSASTIYRDDTFFMINVHEDGTLSLSLFNKNWPKGRTGTVPVSLLVDRRVIDRSKASWLDNGVIINFGRNSKKLISIMRGYGLSIVTPIGTSNFSLKGSYAASLKAVDCFEVASRLRRGTGAFGGQEAGAFDANTAEAPAQPAKLNRSETMEIAAIYLGGIGMPYTILPQRENFFKHLPVNWRYGEGSVGGMMIVAGEDVSGEDVFINLLQDQTRVCTGSSAIKRNKPQKTSNGVVVYTAQGVCQLKGDTFSTIYEVLYDRNIAVVIIELVDELDADSMPSEEARQEENEGLLTRLPRH